MCKVRYMLCVRLSVRLTVTLTYYIETAELVVVNTGMWPDTRFLTPNMEEVS